MTNNIIAPTQSPFHPDARKCGCLGSGWFDASVTEDDDWTACPFHSDDGHPDPRVDPVGHKALLDRLYHELVLGETIPQMPKIASYPLLQSKIPNMPEADIEWLAWQITDFWAQNEFEFVDNDRLAIKGDDSSARAYDFQVLSGCCGFHDVEFGPSPSGRMYLYGFNYGH